MVAALSPEGQIDAGLRSLQCSGRNFIEIAKALGARVGTGSFSESLNGKRSFDRDTGERLLEILSRMRELQNAIYSAVDLSGQRIGFVQIDWARTDKIADALTFRLIAATAKEIGVENPELQDAADQATRQTI